MRSRFQFFSQKKNSEQPKPRLICLKGQTGTLACRVHDPLTANIIPQRSKPWGRLKYAWLSEEKMHNLVAVRGRPGASMVGPADYFCDLDRSDQYLYTFNITPEKAPVINQHPLNSDNHPIESYCKTVSADQITKVKAKWFSGFNKEAIRRKKAEYPESTVFGGNLFPNSGILEIDDPKEIRLQAFDPRGVDLSAFKARLVPNDEPFQITAERLNVDDEYCAVSYQYDAGYADEQVKNGGGIFLEFHEFAQTITPLDENNRGFVTLAKWNELRTQLELIAIEIPYGYTLIIDKNCIHGDTTLDGLFMMCMTSDHVTMRTADTVFLKHAASKDNITMKIDGSSNTTRRQRLVTKMDPLVFYQENREASFANFKTKTEGMDFIFTPTQGYWEVKKETIVPIGLWMLAGTCLVGAMLMIQTMLIPALVLLAVSGLLAGIGLWAVISSETPEEIHPISEAFAI